VVARLQVSERQGQASEESGPSLREAAESAAVAA
jgi:hypothetical protein